MPERSTRKILVTGVAGLIGSHLLDRLLSDAKTRVVGFDDLSVGTRAHLKRHLRDPRFKFIRGDVCDKKAVAAAARGCGTIVHLAAAKKIGEEGNALRTLTVNSEGTRAVLEAARPLRKKVIFASTSDVYGASRDIPFSEEGNSLIGPPTAKRWAYAVSKMYAEQLALAYHKEHEVPVVILRYFGSFSARSSFSGSGGHVPLFINSILKNAPVLIHGDGTQTRSMGYVDDIIDGTLAAMESPDAVGEVINLGNTEEMSVLECARLIHSLAGTGKKLKLKFIPQKKIFGTYRDIARRIPDLRKAKALLGFAPKVTMKEAVIRTLKERRKSGS
jgi:UDP-glucose 4-epimerase